MTRVYVFNWALQCWLDGDDGDTSLSLQAAPNFSAVIVARSGDVETDEALWEGIAATKRTVEQEYIATEDGAVALRWVDDGWTHEEGWSPSRMLTLLDDDNVVAMVGITHTEVGMPLLSGSV